MNVDKLAIYRIRKLMRYYRLSQRDLARRIYVCEATISKYLQGKREFSEEHLADIARVLGTSVDYLLTGANPPVLLYQVQPHVKRQRRKGETKFAERLDATLRTSGISQAELEAAAGVYQTQISRYLEGKSEPKISNLARLARALHVTTDYLLGIDD
jgi:transcriptional regulator with XRE-family HTH domain